MTKEDLIRLIEDEGTLNNAQKSKLISWTKGLPRSGSQTRPTKIKLGDVFFHPIFMHPYVLLEKREDGWLCGLITTEEDCNEILEQCNSRFFGSE